MLKINRIHQIESYITEKERVSMEELCHVFKVSINTIRRDLNELEKQNKIKKVYGGVILNDRKVTEPFESRQIKNKDAKQSIAKCASELIHDGDIIFIDSGTTTMHMVSCLSHKENITIITNNLNIILGAIPYPNLNIISVGGTLSRRTNSFINMEATNFLKNYNFSKAFMATTGVSIARGVTNSSTFEYEIKKYIVENCEKIILLADDSKIDHASLITYYELKDIDVFITNSKPSDEYIHFFHDHRIELMISQ